MAVIQRAETSYTQDQVIDAFNHIFTGYQAEIKPLWDKLQAGKRLDYYRERLPSLRYFYTLEGIKIVTGRIPLPDEDALPKGSERYSFDNNFGSYQQEEGIPVEGMLAHQSIYRNWPDQDDKIKRHKEALVVLEASYLPYYWQHAAISTPESNARVRQEAFWIHQNPLRDSLLRGSERNAGYWLHADEDWFMAERTIGERRELIMPSV